MKYKFIEFIAALEGDDFDKLEQSLLTHYTNLLKDYLINLQYHQGDCTKSCHTCMICLLENWINDYREYTFNEDKWRDGSGIPPSLDKIRDDKLNELGI